MDDSNLRIGDNILSFQDLVEEGYSVRIERPSLEIEIFKNESKEIIEEENTENVQDVIDIEPVVNKSNNKTEEVEIDIPELELVEEPNNANNSDEVIEEPSVENDIIQNDSSINEEIVEKVELANDSLEYNGEPIESAISLESDEEVQEGFSKITGFVVNNIENNLEIKDIEYDNRINVYIERDFVGTDYIIGDVLYLDPTIRTITIGNITGTDVDLINVSG